MSYLQIKGEPILPIRRQDLAELILANKGVLADRWKVNSLNMPARSSGTSSRRQDVGVRPDRWCATQRSKTRLLNIGCIDHWLIHTWAPDYMCYSPWDSTSSPISAIENTNKKKEEHNWICRWMINSWSWGLTNCNDNETISNKLI